MFIVSLGPFICQDSAVADNVFGCLVSDGNPGLGFSHFNSGSDADCCCRGESQAYAGQYGRADPEVSPTDKMPRKLKENPQQIAVLHGRGR